MPNLVGVANSHLALQLSLAGVHVESAQDSAEAEEILQGLLGSDALLVVVQEDLRQGFSEWFEDHLAKHRSRPLVVFCPHFETDEPEVDEYLAAVLKPAIGYEIRLD